MTSPPGVEAGQRSAAVDLTESAKNKVSIVPAVARPMMISPLVYVLRVNYRMLLPICSSQPEVL